MNKIPLLKKILTLAFVFLLMGEALLVSLSCSTSREPLRIGVLLPLSGYQSIASDKVLNWALDNLNSTGGINHRLVELVYWDTTNANIVTLANELVEDSSIQVVIGPCRSSEVYEIASLFIDNKKLLISPQATAGDIFRAFGGNDFIWRTCPSDIDQIRTILYLLSKKNAHTISYLYEDGTYAKTFSDWIGFFSLELGINLLHMVKFESNGEKDWSNLVQSALEGSPDYIVCAVSSSSAIEIKRELDSTSSPTKLFFTDSAATPYLIQALGNAANGLEGTIPTSDPNTGFDAAYASHFGNTPPSYAAPTYDAFLLAAYTLARQEYLPEEPIQESLKQIINGRGIDKGWNIQDVQDTVSLILKGESPNVNGASGPLEFDVIFGVDPIITFYSYWQVRANNFYTVDIIGAGQTSQIGTIQEGASGYRTMASQRLMELESSNETNLLLGQKHDLWAVIVAASSGWENYRHQADALSIYNLLRQNGVDDDHIILFLYDDIANNELNKFQNDVHIEVDGSNLRKDAVVDYSGQAVNVQNIKNVMVGNATPEANSVLLSDNNSNVLFYLAGHGGEGYLTFGVGEIINSDDIIDIVEEMELKGRFRQLFIMTEACYGESMALNLNTPRTIFFTGASRQELAFGCNYDREIGAWLADDFTYQTLKLLLQDPTFTIQELYTAVYQRVAGSHVRIMNYANFGSIATTPMSDFLQP